MHLILLVLTLVVASEACEKFVAGPFFQKNMDKWTWHRATDACLRKYNELGGHGKTFYDGRYHERWCVPPVGYRESFSHMMITKWWCVTRCATSHGGSSHNGPICFLCSIGCFNGIHPHAHIKGSPKAKDNAFRCACHTNVFTESANFRMIHDAFMKECYAGDNYTPGCEPLPHVIANAVTGTDWTYAPPLTDDREAIVGADATIPCKDGWISAIENGTTKTSTVTVTCMHGATPSDTKIWSPVYQCIDPLTLTGAKYDQFLAVLNVERACITSCQTNSILTNKRFYDRLLAVMNGVTKDLIELCSAYKETMEPNELCSGASNINKCRNINWSPQLSGYITAGCLKYE